VIPQGMTATIPKGTPIYGTFKGRQKVAGRTYEVKVFTVDTYGSGKTKICWVGAGGYWYYASLADCTLHIPLGSA
jgi:hypothetical protein